MRIIGNIAMTVALVLGLAAPAAAVKITVDNQTSAGWHFTVMSEKNHSCNDLVGAGSQSSCDAVFGVTVTLASVSRWNPEGRCLDCPVPLQCIFGSSNPVRATSVEVSIDANRIYMRAGGQVLKVCR
jgi:hypothetical protein